MSLESIECQSKIIFYPYGSTSLYVLSPDPPLHAGQVSVLSEHETPAAVQAAADNVSVLPVQLFAAKQNAV